MLLAKQRGWQHQHTVADTPQHVQRLPASFISPQQPWTTQQHLQEQQLLHLQQQRLSMDPSWEPQQPGQSPSRERRPHLHMLPQQQQRPHVGPSTRQHQYNRHISLAKALHVTPEQAWAMLETYPVLFNYSHDTLARKLQEMASIMDVQPQQLSQALCRAPKVLGFSLTEFERRLMGLSWIQPDPHLLAEWVLESPQLLTWPSKHLQARMQAMSRLLDLSSNSLVQLLQQYPRLLPTSGSLKAKLQLLQQLLLMAANSEQAGFGTGVLSLLQENAQHNSVQLAGSVDDARLQQQQALATAARHFALENPQLLLMEPEVLQGRVAAMQATSGLPAAQVAAMLVSQPALLLDG